MPLPIAPLAVTLTLFASFALLISSGWLHAVAGTGLPPGTLGCNTVALGHN